MEEREEWRKERGDKETREENGGKRGVEEREKWRKERGDGGKGGDKEKERKRTRG